MSGDGAAKPKQKKVVLCGHKQDATVRYTTGLCGWCTRQVLGPAGTSDCGLRCAQRPGHDHFVSGPCRCTWHLWERIGERCPYIYPYGLFSSSSKDSKGSN